MVRLLLVSMILASSAMAADIELGKKKFSMMCSSCHGQTGAGDGPAGGALNPKPRNLQDAAWQDATDDERIKTVINKGGAAVGLSPLMPPLGASMKPEEVDGIVAFIRSLKK